MARYEQQLFEYLNSLQRNIQIQPLILGAVMGSGGGLGGRAGGFIGMLPQTRVAYDLSEDETLYTPSSGATLVDNLNHIRYRITILETASGVSNVDIYDNDILIASGVTVLNFQSNLSVSDIGGGQVNITHSGHVVHNQYLFTVDGVVSSGVVPYRISMQDVGTNSNIEEIYCTVNTPPITSVRVNVYKNGSTIFSGTEYIEIPSGAYTASRDTNLTNTSLTKNDILQTEVVLGDTSAEYLVTHVRYNYEV